MKLLLVAGARPNFMKIAPLERELKRCSISIPGFNLSWKLVHTGQHYDNHMSSVFFKELGIAEPDYYLNAGGGTHAQQTAKIMVGFEEICSKDPADIVLVVGDVNSTIACSITAKKLHMKVAHVEAGLRSGDMSMPEEINRMVTDSISDFFFATEQSSVDNLVNEGKDRGHIYYVGNIMIDNLYYQLGKMGGSNKTGKYGVVTLHRPSNVDEEKTFSEILKALVEISKDIPLFFPAHPRTKKQLHAFGLVNMLNSGDIKLLPPLAYMEFLGLWKNALFVLTDSGGLQEETTALGVPCFTIRENTERPITVTEGTNTLTGTTYIGILNAYNNYKAGKIKQGKIPDLWDGNTAKRIVDILAFL